MGPGWWLGGRVGGVVAQVEHAVAFLHKGHAGAVSVATGCALPRRARAGAFTLDILELVVRRGQLEAVAAVDLPVRADLPTEQPLGLTVLLVDAVGSGRIRGVFDRERTQGAEQAPFVAERVIEDRGHAVEIEVGGVHHVGGVERVGDTPRGQGHGIVGFPAQVTLVEPDVLLAKATAQGLGGGHRVIVRTGAQANTRGPLRRDHRFHAQARAQAEQVLAVLGGVDQRRELGVRVLVDVIRAGVIELGEVGDFRLLLPEK